MVNQDKYVDSLKDNWMVIAGGMLGGLLLIQCKFNIKKKDNLLDMICTMKVRSNYCLKKLKKNNDPVFFVHNREFIHGFGIYNKKYKQFFIQYK